MHSGVKQARQDEALTGMARAVQEGGTRLDRIEEKVDQILALLREARSVGPPPKGGR